MALLEADGLRLRYDDDLVLHDVSLAVEEGEIVALLGPSGCGKTSILRVIAGLVKAEAGVVRFDGRPIDDVAPHKRGFGFMFQEFALFPHLNVAQNVEFGLRMQRQSGPARRARVSELLTLVGLAGYEQRKVHQLSGGERQRVALARSLAPSPRLLMLDEPLGSLDRRLREQLLLELRTILTQVHQTSIYVTHDQDEAFSLADRVLIMERGVIRQSGRPEEIFAQPADAFVARFIGLGNLVEATMEAQVDAGDGRLVAHTALGDLTLPARESLTPGAAVTLLLGDEQASLAKASGAPTACGSFAAEVLQRSFRGRRLTFRLRAGGQELLFDVDTRPAHRAIAEGDTVVVTPDPAAIRVLT